MLRHKRTMHDEPSDEDLTRESEESDAEFLPAEGMGTDKESSGEKDDTSGEEEDPWSEITRRSKNVSPSLKTK